MASQRPPLALHAEVVYPDGTTARWDKDSREAKDRPTGITFRTQRYNGFADGRVTLNRRIDLEYPDLRLLDGLNLIGHDGSVAYEGRIASMPRDLQATPQITMQAQGWMSHAKDQSFVEIYVDRDLSKWGGQLPQMQRKALEASQDPHDGNLVAGITEGPALRDELIGAWSRLSVCEMVYDGGSCPLASLYYDWLQDPDVSLADTNWVFQAYFMEDDNNANLDSSGNLRIGSKTGIFAATHAKQRYARFQFYYAVGGGGAGQVYGLNWRKIAVYGAHGLTKRGAEPGGFYASDVMANIAQRWAPKLDTSGIEQTDFPVPHLAFPSDTLPYDAFTALNAFHRWELAVYEKRKLLFYPNDLGDYDWEVRLCDPGTKVTLQGDDAANLCNGVVVKYTDLDTGTEQRLTPAEYPELADNSLDNPANLNGLNLWTTLSLSVPTTKEGAIQIGSVYLGEFNQAKSPGQITVMGHIRDRAGHWQQAWKVRAGDRLIISDLPNDSVRVVGETEWNHDAKTLSISVDSSFKRLDAILARVGVSLEAANLKI